MTKRQRNKALQQGRKSKENISNAYWTLHLKVYPHQWLDVMWFFYKRKANKLSRLQCERDEYKTKLRNLRTYAKDQKESST